MNNEDIMAKAREIVAEKAVPRHHKCAPPRPWWLPRRFAKCTYYTLRNVAMLISGGLVICAEARIQAECCRRHGAAR